MIFTLEEEDNNLKSSKLVRKYELELDYKWENESEPVICYFKCGREFPVVSIKMDVAWIKLQIRWRIFSKENICLFS